MQEFFEILFGVVIALFIVFMLVICIWDALAKEHPQKIHVIHKRETLHRSAKKSTGQPSHYTHYTIDCTFPDSDKLHTFDCEADVFQKLKQGKHYTVIVKRLSILSIQKNRWD